MLLYTKKDVIGVSFKKDIEIEEFEEIDTYDDIVLRLKAHLDYVGGNIDLLNLSFLEGIFVRECDYCGRKIYTKEGQGRPTGQNVKSMSNTYQDDDAEYPSTNDCCGRQECKALKRRLTTWTRYGVEHPFYLNEYKDKWIEARRKTGWETPCSRPQQYLAYLLNGEVNVRIKEIGGFVDIILKDEKIVIEYDGSGHFLGEFFGKYTREEKMQADYERDLILRSLGYKIIRIESENDFLPSDEVILKQIEDIKQYFKESGKEFFKWVIPKSKKDKRYGRLREITEDDIDKLKSSLKS